MSVWLAASPLLMLCAGGLAMMMVDAFVKEKAELATMSTVILFGSAALSFAVWQGGAPAQAPEPLAPYLAVDGLAQFFNLTICMGGGLSALLAGGYLAEHRMERGEYYTLLVFSAFGAMTLAAATDLLTLFIGLETMSLGVYTLVGFRRTSPRSAEAAMKYFMLGSFAAAILLFGSALLYGATGHTDFAGIGEAVSGGHADLRLTLLAMFMLIVGLAFKVGAVPFHMWTPDAYEGAVTPATTFMSVAVKAAGFAAMLRLLLGCFGDPLSASATAGWPPILAIVAVITMVYGNVAAVYQTSVKRMLAYSSIAHAGYILVGVVSTFREGVREAAVSSVLFYLLAYTVSNVLAFGSLIAMGSHGKEAVSYADLAGAGRRHPMVAVPFVIGILSLMGFPPTAGFFAKYYVFKASIDVGGAMIYVAIIGVLSSAVGAYYYLKVLVFLFMKQPEPGAPEAVPMRSGYITLALILAGYFVMKMGVSPSNYIDLAVRAAANLV